jgi:hypothetical protein
MSDIISSEPDLQSYAGRRFQLADAWQQNYNRVYGHLPGNRVWSPWRSICFQELARGEKCPTRCLHPAYSECEDLLKLRYGRANAHQC